MTSSRFPRTGARALAAALGIAAFAWAAAATAQSQEAIERYRAGYDLLLKRDFRNAAIELEAAVAVDSTYDVAYYALSRAHQALGHPLEAAAALEAALRHGLQQPMGQAPRAFIDSLRQTLLKSDPAPRAWIDSLRASLRHSYAIQLSSFYFNGGLESRRQRRFGEAILHLETSLRYQPDHHWIDSLEAVLDGELRPLRESASPPAWIDSLVQGARHHGPKHHRHRAKAHYVIGLCHLSLRQPDQAVPALEAAIAEEADYAWPYLSLGHIHHQRGDLRQSARMYEKAIAVDGSVVQAYSALARVRLASEDLEGAVKTLKKAVKVDPEYSAGLVLLGTTLNHLQRYDEAVTALKRAVEIDPKNAEGHYRLSEAYLGTGQARPAAKAAQEALRGRKDYYAAMVVLADAHADLGEIGQARTWYQRATKDSRQRDYCNHKLQELEADQATAEGR